LITERLALDYAPSLTGLHLTGVPFPRLFVPPVDPSAEEQAYLTTSTNWLTQHAAYVTLQGRQPNTLVPSLRDSPAGLAAWLLDKFRAWSDCGGDVESRFSKDELLTNLTLYWATNTIGSSFAHTTRPTKYPKAWVHQKSRGRRALLPSAATCYARRAPLPSASTRCTSGPEFRVVGIFRRSRNLRRSPNPCAPFFARCGEALLVTGFEGSRWLGHLQPYRFAILGNE
jgi:hypothetical protein